MAGFFNNGLIVTQNHKIIADETLIIINDDLFAGSVNQFFCEGINTITLPPIVDDSTTIELIVLNGETTVTSDINGITNQVFKIPNQKITLIRHDSEYSIASIGQVDTANIMHNGVKFYFDTLNSTTTNLASGATHSGSIVDVTQYPDISLLAHCNEPLLITVYQYVDEAGIRQCKSPESFSIMGDEPFGVSFPINGNYIRVETTNAGGSTSTEMQVDVAYGVIAPTLYQQGKTLISQPMTTGSQIINVNDWNEGTIQVVSTATAGTFIFEGSNDGVNYEAIAVQTINAPNTDITTAITATVSNKIYKTKVLTKFIKIKIVTNLTGGNIVNYVKLK